MQYYCSEYDTNEFAFWRRINALDTTGEAAKNDE